MILLNKVAIHLTTDLSTDSVRVFLLREDKSYLEAGLMIGSGVVESSNKESGY